MLKGLAIKHSSAQTLSQLFFWMMSQFKLEHVLQEEVVILSQESVHGWMLLMASQMDVTGFMQTVTTEVLWSITQLTLQMVRVYSFIYYVCWYCKHFSRVKWYTVSGQLFRQHILFLFPVALSGMFLLSPSQRNTQGQKTSSVLISEKIQPTSDSCFEFWYHMNGRSALAFPSFCFS